MFWFQEFNCWHYIHWLKSAIDQQKIELEREFQWNVAWEWQLQIHNKLVFPCRHLIVQSFVPLDASENYIPFTDRMSVLQIVSNCIHNTYRYMYFAQPSNLMLLLCTQLKLHIICERKKFQVYITIQTSGIKLYVPVSKYTVHFCN